MNIELKSFLILFSVVSTKSQVSFPTSTLLPFILFKEAIVIVGRQQSSLCNTGTSVCLSAYMDIQNIYIFILLFFHLLFRLIVYFILEE